MKHVEHHGILGRLGPLARVALALLGLGSCQRTNNVVIPNRVLDRPLDVALACIDRERGIEPREPAQCFQNDESDCTSTRPLLLGFIANSERNEVAVFRRCDKMQATVDLDPGAPGHNFLPVGRLPSRIVRSHSSCHMVTANVGSCDLSVIDVATVASLALPESEATDDDAAGKMLSTAVSTIVPRTAGGQPMGARPIDLIAVPPRLSRIGDEVSGATTPGGGPPGVGDPSGADTPDGPTAGAACGPEALGSVYVAFPGCQLIAELSLRTQQVLQSRRFVTAADGSVTVVDAGTAPSCPVECPIEGAMAPGEKPSSGGFFPRSIVLIERSDPAEPAAGAGRNERPGRDNHRDAIDRDALLVGGAGSDVLVEIEILEDGRTFAPPGSELTLRLAESPGGVTGIRPTPVVQLDIGDGAGNDDQPYEQFLYVLAADGSTRVVLRDLAGAELGRECDTQAFSNLAVREVCLDPRSEGRHPFARGPGLRANGGAAFLDWTFLKADEGGRQGESMSTLPLGRPELVGVGVTSFGTIVYSTFDQFVALSQVQDVDLQRFSPLEVGPHVLWPAVTDPNMVEAWPRLSNQAPVRTLPDVTDPTARLSPSLRRIDLAYVTPGGPVMDTSGGMDVGGGGAAPDGEPRDEPFGPIVNEDRLDKQLPGGVPPMYTKPVVRALSLDYRYWTAQDWTLEWEAPIPGGVRSTGRVAAPEADDDLAEFVLIDDGAAFCDRGVMAGDRLLFPGCKDDKACGEGRVCLKDPEGKGSGSDGLCVAADVDQDALFENPECRPFFQSSCGQAPRREFEVVWARHDRIGLRPAQRPVRSFLRRSSDFLPDNPKDAGKQMGWSPCGDERLEDVPGDPGTGELQECEARLTCELPTQWAAQHSAAPGTEIDQPQSGCRSHDACAHVLADPSASGEETTGGMDGGTDKGSASVPYFCIDGACRRRCEDTEACLLMPSPPTEPPARGGPTCFDELVTYQVRIGNAMLLRSGSGGWIPRTRVDPGTGLCVEDTDLSELLRSRIPIPENQTALERVPPCKSDRPSPFEANPCRITVRRSVSPDSLFHLFSYRGDGSGDATVEALRFSTPTMALTLDLTSLLDLAAPVPPDNTAHWPVPFAAFRRSRIPSGYKETFSSLPGYLPRQDIGKVGAPTVGPQPLVFPVRIIQAPESPYVFVVDAGGTGSFGVRGQVARIEIGLSGAKPDNSFLAR